MKIKNPRDIYRSLRTETINEQSNKISVQYIVIQENLTIFSQKENLTIYPKCVDTFYFITSQS